MRLERASCKDAEIELETRLAWRAMDALLKACLNLKGQLNEYLMAISIYDPD